jgi:hypothetical protein
MAIDIYGWWAGFTIHFGLKLKPSRFRAQFARKIPAWIEGDRGPVTASETVAWHPCNAGANTLRLAAVHVDPW